MTRQNQRMRIVVAWLPAILYTLLIWWLSSQTLELALLERVPLQDKGVHFLEYGALGFFIAHAVTTTWPGRGIGTLVSVIITVSLGLLDELHQAFVPGRSSDVLDLAADSAGALTAALLYAGIARLVRGKQEPVHLPSMTSRPTSEDVPSERPSGPDGQPL